MSQSENAGEQSMEEILASIRGTVSSGEPKVRTDSPSAVRTPEPPAPPASAAPPNSPVPHRLSDALSRVSGETVANEQAAPAPTSAPTSAQSFGTSPKATAIDDDLLDLFEDPKPSSVNGVAPPTSLSSGDNTRTASDTSQTATLAPARSPSFGARMTAGAVSTAPATIEITPAAPSPTATPAPAETAPSPQTGRTSYSGLGPMPSAPGSASEVTSSAEPREPIEKAPEVIAAMPASATSPSAPETPPPQATTPAKMEPQPSISMATGTATSGATSQATTDSTLYNGSSATDGGGSSLAALAATLGQLSAESLHPAPTPKTEAPSNVATPSTSSDAATEPPPAAAPKPPAAASTVAPTSETTRAQSEDASPAEPTSDAENASTRTLEDVVVDILRPQLQSWLEANMPRIVERALRAEAAGGKSPKRARVDRD